MEKCGEYVGKCATVWIYGDIFEVYKGSPQVTDTQIEKFMQQFEEYAVFYGSKAEYYKSRLKLGVMYQDVEMAAEAAEGLLSCKISGCYLCAMGLVLQYYLLVEDYDALETLYEQMRTRTIPAKYQWSYKQCLYAEEKNLVMAMLVSALDFGRMDFFYKFLEKNKACFQNIDEKEELYVSEYVFMVCIGEWNHVKKAIKDAEETEEDLLNFHVTVEDGISNCLFWYVYFTMLHQSGRKEVEIQLKGEEAPVAECGKMPPLEVARYFEKMAETMGRKMEQSREKFHYDRAKASYDELINYYGKKLGAREENEGEL